eukprot:Gb_36828 [translate_table: standard]
MALPTEEAMDMVVQMDEYWFCKNVMCTPVPTPRLSAAATPTTTCVDNGNHNPTVECSKDEEPSRPRLFDRRHRRSSSDHMCLDLSKLGIQRHGVHKRATSLDFTTHTKACVQQPKTVQKIPAQQPPAIKMPVTLTTACLDERPAVPLTRIGSKFSKTVTKLLGHVAHLLMRHRSEDGLGRVFEEPAQTKTGQKIGKPSVHHRERKKGVKSLTDLEFDELKGFMDLGFSFSKDDLTPRVVSMIPGLQRLGNNETTWAPTVSRPYLSEAWLMPRTGVPLPNWHMPGPQEQGVKMKEHLKFWAHAVASTARMEC